MRRACIHTTEPQNGNTQPPHQLNLSSSSSSSFSLLPPSHHMLADAAVETILSADIAKLDDATCVDLGSKVNCCGGEGRGRHGGREGGKEGRKERRREGRKVSTQGYSLLQFQSLLLWITQYFNHTPVRTRRCLCQRVQRLRQGLVLRRQELNQLLLGQIQHAPRL